MEEASRVTVSDPGSGLPAFLAHFDSLEFNSLLASHFHRFGPPFGSFLCFSVPVEGLPFLEGLFKAHGDFTSGFRGGIFLGNILIKLLCAVLVSLKDSFPNSLFEERLLEWRGVVRRISCCKSFSISAIRATGSGSYAARLCLETTFYSIRGTSFLCLEAISCSPTGSNAHPTVLSLSKPGLTARLEDPGLLGISKYPGPVIFRDVAAIFLTFEGWVRLFLSFIH
ncbi:hypothetical protein SO802_015595 [Lithocarpus litseifolius]|uniref:Uncharacterized protein n=1 Tax=Lithocarpus litseifolius TaxID=425828 RepID=A0AAW2CUR5_9ROSI